MRFLISLLAFLGVATAQAAPTSSVQWGYDPTNPQAVQYKVGTTWFPVPLITVANTWTQAQTFTVNPIFSAATAHGLLLGQGASAITSIGPAASGQLLLGQGAAADPAFFAMSGDATLAGTGALTLATVNAAPGTYGDQTHSVTQTVDGKGRITILSSVLITPDAANVTYTPTATGGVGKTLAYLQTATSVLVDSFGAAHDGVTDDALAFTKAFNALPAYGGIVTTNCNFNYAILSNITIPSAVTLKICNGEGNIGYDWRAGTTVPAHVNLGSLASFILSSGSGLEGIILQSGIAASLPVANATGFAGTAIKSPAGALTDVRLRVLTVGFQYCFDGSASTQIGRADFQIECDGQAGAAGSTNGAIQIPPSLDTSYYKLRTWQYATAAYPVSPVNTRTGYGIKFLTGNSDDSNVDAFDAGHEIGIASYANGAVHWRRIWSEVNSVAGFRAFAGSQMDVGEMSLYSGGLGSTPAIFNGGDWDIGSFYCGILAGAANTCITTAGGGNNIHIGQLKVNGGGASPFAVNIGSTNDHVTIDSCSISNMSGSVGPLWVGPAGWTVDQVQAKGCITGYTQGQLYGGTPVNIPSAASAQPLQIGLDYDMYRVTGTAGLTITSIGGYWGGRRVILTFDVAATLAAGGNLALTGGVNFSAAAGSSIAFWADSAGTYHEMWRH